LSSIAYPTDAYGTTRHILATRTDAKGRGFKYNYDSYKRLLTVSVGGTLLRTYSYDTNSYDATYSQYSAARLIAIQYRRGQPAAGPPPK
jgi:hypothetical protein